MHSPGAVAGLAGMAWGIQALLTSGLGLHRIMATVVGASVLWTTLAALWVRRGELVGESLTAADAPGLFEALARIRKHMKGPAIHRVVLDDDFNAGVIQRRRWGMLGSSINELVIGLPLLMALDRGRLLSVLAHEYGHLCGNHNHFRAWVYRTRVAWLRLARTLETEDGPRLGPSFAFFRWYFPRFAARSFALARQDEYEADRAAAGLLGHAPNAKPRSALASRCP